MDYGRLSSHRLPHQHHSEPHIQSVVKLNHFFQKSRRVLNVVVLNHFLNCLFQVQILNYWNIYSREQILHYCIEQENIMV